MIPNVLGGEMKGNVTVCGLSTSKHAVVELSAKVQIVFQDPEAQMACLTPEDEIAFGPENLLVPREEILMRITKYLRAVGMERYREAFINELSGGQKQRVALAAVLAMEPEVLILDAPTSNLDPAGAREVFSMIDDLRRRYTVLLIEKQLDELVQKADTLVLMDDGKILQAGPPREILEKMGPHVSRKMGLYIPEMVELGLRLQEKGVKFDPFPLTISEMKQSILKELSRGGLRIAPTGVSERPSLSATNMSVEVRNLSYDYPNGVNALQNVSISVPRGDIAALIGANGAGKTTLAKHIIGLIRAPRGTVFIDGIDIRTLSSPEITAKVAYAFQYPEHQFIEETVYDEIAYSLRARGLDEMRVKVRVEEMLELTGLRSLQGSHPYRLSMGEKRRLSVATIIAIEPDILILDEPTFGQDWKSVEKTMEIVENMNRKGTTILMITHDMRVVCRWARTVTVMSEGRGIGQGPVRELFQKLDVLEKASLDPPPVARLAHLLHDHDARIRQDILTLDEMDRSLQPLV
jgi:energy-coupling factor transport system ATP-binding protein